MPLSPQTVSDERRKLAIKMNMEIMEGMEGCARSCGTGC